MEDIFKNYSNLYFSKIQSRLLQLEEEIQKEEEALKELRELSVEKQKEVEAERLHVVLLSGRYNNFINKIKTNGILLKAENKRFKLREWDNLTFERKKAIVSMQNMYKEEIIAFDKDESKLLIELLSQYNYNLIVIEINSREIVIQLRLSDKE
ncbi:MAG: hypothetical protein AB6733_17170 [Clostridiaceae bacterium]